MTHVVYEYASGDFLAERPKYEYTDCLAPDFLDAWRLTRAAAVAELESRSAPCESRRDSVAVHVLLDDLEAGLTASDPVDGRVAADLHRLVQRFEASKRLWDRYLGPELRGDTSSGYRELTRYVRFGALLAIGFARLDSLQCLNALLKVGDLLCAHAEEIPGSWRRGAADVLREEAVLVSSVASRGEALCPT